MYKQYIVRKVGSKVLLVNIFTNEIMEIDSLIENCIYFIQEKDGFDDKVFSDNNGITLQESQELWEVVKQALGDE